MMNNGEREEELFSTKEEMFAYVDSFDFKEMNFGEAFRFFLKGFKFPKENDSQKFCYIFEKFGERFFKCNPNTFSSAEPPIVMAFSVMLLNMDAHHPASKRKMSKDDFIFLRCLDKDNDFLEEYLGALYDEVVTNEIKVSKCFGRGGYGCVGLREGGADGAMLMAKL